jgi:hypothetical protein
MTVPANKKIRQMKGSTVEDVLNAASLTFNRASGGQKNLGVGPHLKPLLVDPATNTYSTDATTARTLRPGVLLAIFNKGSSVYSVTLGSDTSVAALAVGVTNSNGEVGIPCKPGDWTYLSTFDKRTVITNNNNLVVFVVEDDTYIVDENPSR